MRDEKNGCECTRERRMAVGNALGDCDYRVRDRNPMEVADDLGTVFGDYFRMADHSDRTTVMAGIRQHPLGAGKSSARCAVPSTRTLTERFSLKYSSSPLHRSFFERCIMNQNSARILASRKECYARKNRSPE